MGDRAIATVAEPPSGAASSKKLGRNVIAMAAVSFFTDVSSEMIYPLLPLFLGTVLGASASTIGAIEGLAESTAALLKLASGWWSDRVRRRKPLVLAGYALASFVRPLVAIAQSSAQVLAVRVGDRIGKGIRTSPRDALIADSVDPSIRGRAFGFHRAGDDAGAVLGPLIAFFVLRHLSASHPTTAEVGAHLRTMFWLAGIPGLIAVAVLIVAVRDVPRTGAPAERGDARTPRAPSQLGGRFWGFLGVVLLFTLGNSTDAFLLLRASQLGVPTVMVPILWAMHQLSRSVSSTPGGALSDRVGRKPLIIGGWLLYALVYFAFGRATLQWEAWALFAIYGLYFGMTEGVQSALVADIVPASRRGSAFGWYYLAIGVGALPASLIFGAIWDRFGAPTAFSFGAALAGAACVGIALLPTRHWPAEAS